MKRKTVRNVTVGALTTGLVPLVAAGLGADPAGAGDQQSPVALCRSSFGEHGPYGGSITGEGPPGDPMTVTVGWEAAEWPDGIREAITCIGIGGKSALALTRSTLAPPNTGNLMVDLMLPPGPAGSLVCQQTILIGKGVRDGQQRQSDPVCFKLRAAEQMTDGSATGGQTSSRKAPVERIPGDVRSLLPGGSAANPGPGPVAKSISTPPARASFEAARGAVRSPQAWTTPTARPAPALAPTAPATHPGQAADELARTPVVSGRAAGTELAAGRPSGVALGRKAGATNVAAPRTSTAAKAKATAAVAGNETARSALPRTGVGDKIPLAGAGGLLAIGGAAIILGEPRRRGARKPA